MQTRCTCWLAATFRLGVLRAPLTLTHSHTYMIREQMKMIAIIGTSDQPCWPAEACKILLLTHFELRLI